MIKNILHLAIAASILLASTGFAANQFEQAKYYDVRSQAAYRVAHGLFPEQIFRGADH